MVNRISDRDAQDAGSVEPKNWVFALPILSVLNIPAVVALTFGSRKPAGCEPGPKESRVQRNMSSEVALFFENPVEAIGKIRPLAAGVGGISKRCRFEIG